MRAARVKRHGQAAVVTGRMNVDAKQAGVDIGGDYRFTQVWVSTGDKWRCVSAQFTAISQ